MIKKMTIEEAVTKVLNGELFILDVRNEEDYQQWRIEGKKVESINIPYFHLIDGVEKALQKIPRDHRDLLVVCAKEKSSKFVAEQLHAAGIDDLYYLQGGMAAWSEYLHPVKVGDLKRGGSIYQFNRIGKGCLSYLIESAGQAVIVDAVRMTDSFEQFAQQKGLTISAVIDTHLHADHISGGRKLADKLGATYYLPEKDAMEVTFSYEPLAEGKAIVFKDLKIEPIYSPGHTIGSTSLLIDNQYLLSGDILFVDSIGRPDLAGKAKEWVEDLRQSLYQRYRELPSELFVLPAHYAKISEMDAEGRVYAKLRDLYTNNEGLKIDDRSRFQRLVTENLPPQPNAYQQIRQVNMGKISPSESEQQEMEIGPNRCAVHQ